MKHIVLAGLLLALGGCSTLSMSGYGGTEQFRCGNDFGQGGEPYCNSISENYDASIAGLLNNTDMAKRAEQPYSEQGVRTLMNTPGYASGTPVRSQNEIARIWIAPYLDSDGDLVDQNFTYVVLNQGKWLIEHNQQNIMDEYRPVRLLGGRPEAQQKYRQYCRQRYNRKRQGAGCRCQPESERLRRSDTRSQSVERLQNGDVWQVQTLAGRLG